MNHLILLLVCTLSVEIFVRSNLSSILSSALKVSMRVAHVITSVNISDHWKEKVVPAYALRLMKHSLQMLFVILLILFLFLATEFFVNDFFVFSLSLIGVLESIFFVFGYVFIRKSLIK